MLDVLKKFDIPFFGSLTPGDTKYCHMATLVLQVFYVFFFYCI